MDKIVKEFHGGHIANTVEFPKYTIGKELQCHVLELKGNEPFHTPQESEEVLYGAVTDLSEKLKTKFKVSLLGTGMHPLVQLKNTRVWPYFHKKIYNAYQQVFNFQQHGWMNIQSYQLNLPYENATEAIRLHDAISNIIPYLPAFMASSPIYEGKFGENIDNRLHFYRINQKEIPSITGDLIPEYFNSIEDYKAGTIGKYTEEFKKRKVDKVMWDAEWVNSRGAIFRFDRDAIEIRLMDEQECIKIDVAVSCYIRALLRGLLDPQMDFKPLPHENLVSDVTAITKDGPKAHVKHPKGPTARDVCKYFYSIAKQYANEDEKKYLPLMEKRIEQGPLAEFISKDVKTRAQKTDMKEAIIDVYLRLAKCLTDNKTYY